MIRVDVEHVRAILAEYRRINRLKMDEVEWYENGVRLDIPQAWKDEFTFTGLALCDFVRGEVYKYGFTELDENGVVKEETK